MSVSGNELEDGWNRSTKTERDWKKIFLMIGLGILSWVATYVGMLELIESNMGELPIVHKLIIAAAVAMLMTMIVWLLDQIFAPVPLVTKFIYVLGYIFLTAISVGFGFGFYWKVLESRSETTRSAAGAVTQVQGALVGASARLDQLQSTLTNLTAISRQKAEIEREKGTSCPNSRPGDGPRRKLRDDDAAQFSFASDFVAGRAVQVKGELKALDSSLAMITKGDPKTMDASGTRNDFMRTLNGKLDRTVARYNAFRSDPQLRQIRANLAERSDKTMFPTSNGGTFSCPDPQLQMALRGVVRAIDQLPDVDKPKINAVEGSEATIEAFRRLGATFYGALSLKLPPSADELRERQKRAVLSLQGGQQVRAYDGEQAGLSQRDYIPLAIAMFVDLCLLLVAMGRPMNRLNGLIPTMRAAEQGPMYDILSKFSEIHKTPEVREKFEVFRHVVFDFNGDYYVAVPLDAPYRPNRNHMSGYSKERMEELQQEAHLLANFFASFEKKRIFTRVYSPFLTTKSIQKRLSRQGSKFASCEAFRIYRFRDGAWSEIILNTIMRAAREVEETRRRQAKAAGPSLDVPATAPTEPPAARPEPRRRHALDLGGLDTHWQPETPYGVARPRPIETEKADFRKNEFGPYAPAASRELEEEPGDERLNSLRERLNRSRPNAAPANANVAPPHDEPAYTPDDDNVVPFDPSKGSRASAEPMPRFIASSQAIARDHAPEANQVGVVLTERQARFTVPTTDAILPAGLRHALAGASAAPRALEEEHEDDNPSFIDAIVEAVGDEEPAPLAITAEEPESDEPR
ncbi:MAG: hypothetical protein RLZ98_18 [Pseudomonadota bacterium]|jgi:hypothetical protein